jgi:hypothetical protein
MVIAVAGRRIDAPDARAPRFPSANVPAVRERLRHLFVETRATMIVSSAACGADLLALEIAETLQLRRRIVLPFEARLFREVSVADRAESWGPDFDRLVQSARTSGDLIVLDLPARSQARDYDAAYLAATDAILDEALRQADADAVRAAAAVVWNGQTRGPDDLTMRFRRRAVALGLPVFEIPTL